MHVLEGAWAVRPWREERSETCRLCAGALKEGIGGGWRVPCSVGAEGVLS